MSRTLPPCYGVIPARYASSRFPGKPLAEILGRPMFSHVCERACRCPELTRVVLATDDERIFNKALEMGVDAVMTSPDHASGTDRVLEAARKMEVPPEAVVVNIQGDEPALRPAMVSELVAPFVDPRVEVTTLAHEIDHERAQNPDQVKVVWTKGGKALYFSRSAVPYSSEKASYWGHIGMYAFRMRTLAAFSEMETSPLERREKLEQLRLLENGIDIHVVATSHASRGVDRPEDIEAAAKLILEND